jgi:N-acetylmuramoyl-L-alanine amidase
VIALLLALQTAATALPVAPDTLRVRSAEREYAVPVELHGRVPMIRAQRAVTPLGGVVRALGEGRWLLAIGGAELTLTDGVPFVRLANEALPLAAAPVIANDSLVVPLQLVNEIVPRVASGIIFDLARNELRTFTALARRPGAADASPSRTPRSTRRADAPTADTKPATPSASRAAAKRRRLVVIDAGHGGPDAGMNGPIGRGPRIHEKDVTLSVSRMLAQRLQALGYDTHLTRNRDTLIALGDRGRIANQLRGDLFVSIHVNAANPNWRNPGAARGFETYFLSEAKTEEESRVERMENEAVRFETGADAPKGDPLSFIINDMAQNEHLRESSDLAATLQGAMRDIHPGPDRGVKQANFAVLRTSFMPAVLVEIGFGTNPDEARFIGGTSGQRKLADSLARGIAEYLAHYERRVGVTP